MTIPRSKLVNVGITRWYHCISRCVRRASLLAEGAGSGSERKEWVTKRLEQLAKVFAISVGGFSVMDNHLHLLLRIDPDQARDWTAEEVTRRWFQLFPPRGTNRKRVERSEVENLIQRQSSDAAWVEKMRLRLASLSWFMKCLKEPLSRMVNKLEGCTGAFFEGRFKSIAVLDEVALLAVSAYIDLNPVAAGIASAPESSKYTSVRERIDHVCRSGRTSDLRSALQGSTYAVQHSAQLEHGLWLVPIEDRRSLDSNHEGMLEGFTLGNYLLLVEHTGRIVRQGKAAISEDCRDIFTRIEMTVEWWSAKISRLLQNKFVGRFACTNRERLASVACQLGLRRAREACGLVAG